MARAINGKENQNLSSKRRYYKFTTPITMTKIPL